MTRAARAGRRCSTCDLLGYLCAIHEQRALFLAARPRVRPGHVADGGDQRGVVMRVKLGTHASGMMVVAPRAKEIGQVVEVREDMDRSKWMRATVDDIRSGVVFLSLR